jgi:hypothetical protein
MTAQGRSGGPTDAVTTLRPFREKRAGSSERHQGVASAAPFFGLRSVSPLVAFANIVGTTSRGSRSVNFSQEEHMAKGEQTGKAAGKSASKVLRDDRTGKDSKTAAGSALTQRPSKKK